jgi:hypothetical protein
VSSTGFVTSLIVRSPARIQVLGSPVRLNSVLRNSRVGYFSTSKKSLLRRCASRSALPVLMLEAWTVTIADEADGLAGSSVAPPEMSVNEPRTVEIIACRTAKPSLVWAGSSSQVPASSAGANVRSVVVIGNVSPPR